MKTLTMNPGGKQISVNTETRLLDTLLSEKVPVMMACGGQGICATCHVYVTEGMDQVTPISKREQRTLSLLTGANHQSRLSCQCRVLGEGVKIQLPEGLYVESFSDLEKLVGKRTKVPILHPVDARILIQKGKIITRSRIMELKDVDFNIGSVDFDQ